MELLPAYAELHCLSNFTSCAAPRIPRSWSSARTQLGYAALAITDECSVAGVVRAHLAAKEVGAARSSSAREFTLVDGTQLVLLATDRAATATCAQLITRGAAQRERARYRA